MTEYIEREAAESAIAKLMPSFTTPDGSGQLDEIIFCAQQMCADAIETIRELPTIKAAPVVHGKLESTGMDELYAEFGRCTVCGGDNYIKAKFCNWCGAKLDGGDEHED